MDTVDHAMIGPKVEIVVERALWRQILGHVAPLASRAQHIQQAVDHLAHIHRPSAATPFGGRDERGDQRPFLVGQIARVAKLVAVVARAVVSGPHRKPLMMSGLP